jgi:hypothetical protein
VPPIMAFVELMRRSAVCYDQGAAGIVAAVCPLGADNISLRLVREEVPLIKIGSRILTVLVALAVLATGPLAPLAAAQQPAPTSPPPQQPVPQPEPMAQLPQDVPEQDPRLAEAAAYNVGAGIANVFYIPGKAILCGIGGAVGIGILIISIGSAPRPAAYFAREGCGGRWVLTGDDLRPQAEATFDWERDNKY